MGRCLVGLDVVVGDAELAGRGGCFGSGVLYHPLMGSSKKRLIGGASHFSAKQMEAIQTSEAFGWCFHVILCSSHHRLTPPSPVCSLPKPASDCLHVLEDLIVRS